MRVYLPLAIAAICLATLWPYEKTQEAELKNNSPKDPLEIRVALSDDIRSSQPGVNRNSFADDVLAHAVESLVAHREDLSIAPMAASHYEVSEDLKVYRFTLRDGLKFHNGEDALAKHVKMNWETILDPISGFQCLPFYNGKMGAKVISVETEGDRVVIFKLDRPSSVFLEKLAYIQCPVAILHPDSWNQDGTWNAPIGTGPFKFSEWKKGRYVLLKKFLQYHPRSDSASGLAGRKIAYVDQVRFEVITDLMATKAALISGQIDIANSLAPITALEIRSNARVKAMDKQGLARRVILIQTDDPILSSLKVRQAIAHALDLKTFADVASLGNAAHNPSTLPIHSQYHTDLHSKNYKFNLEKSKRLLREADYQGEKIIIKTTRGEQAFFDSAMIAEAMLKKANINVEVQVMEMASLLGDYFEGNYQLMAFEYTPRFTAFMNYHTLIGDKSVTPSRWGDPLANQLLIEAATYSNPEKLQSIFDKIHTHMMDEVPIINLYNAPIVDVISNRLEGYEPWTGAKPRLWNVKIKEQNETLRR